MKHIDGIIQPIMGISHKSYNPQWECLIKNSLKELYNPQWECVIIKHIDGIIIPTMGKMMFPIVVFWCTKTKWEFTMGISQFPFVIP